MRAFATALALVCVPAVAIADPVLLEIHREDDVKLSFDAALLSEVSFNKSSQTQVSVSPDLTLRTRDVEISIYHSGKALTGFFGLGLGAAICVRGDDCERYRGVGAQAYYNLLRTYARGEGWFDDSLGGVQVGGGPVVTSFDRSEVGIKLGARAWKSKGFGLFEIEPHVIVGAAGRDTSDDVLLVPVRFSLLTILGLETGFAAPLDDVGARWQLPFSLYGRIPLTPGFFVGVAFSLPAIAAGDGVVQTGTEQRAATFSLQYLYW